MNRTLAPDTNLLSFETSRRLLLGIAAELGDTLVVLPEVYVETQRRIAESIREQWVKRLEDDARYTAAEKLAIMDAAAGAAVETFIGEVDSKEPLIKLLKPTMDQAWTARRIAMALPRGIVRRASDPKIKGDSLIIAEAVVFDVALLSTNNLRTIWHEPANKWAAERFHRTTPLLYTPDKTLTLLSGQSADLRYQWTLAYGMRPAEMKGDVRASRTIYEAALTRIAGAGFAMTAKESRWLYEHDMAFEKSLQSAGQRKGIVSASGVEQRLAQNIRAAVQDAGWSPAAPSH